MARLRKIREIRLKRAYEAPAADDGCRVLVDRLWPRGVSKEAVRLDLWLRDLAPSTVLREWYHHRPELWEEMRRRYFDELRSHQEARAALAELRAAAAGRTLTLVFAARDTERNNAVALREFLLHGGAEEQP
jgi:uncharacterized protein YeaO (DUF488 family)